MARSGIRLNRDSVAPLLVRVAILTILAVPVYESAVWYGVPMRNPSVEQSGESLYAAKQELRRRTPLLQRAMVARSSVSP